MNVEEVNTGTEKRNAELSWEDEIRRRDEDLRHGVATTRPVHEVLRDARKRLESMTY